jgi:hypothetical protein
MGANYDERGIGMSEERIVNGVNVDRLFETINAIKDTPGLARFRFRAQNTWVCGGHNRTTITGFYGACEKHPLTEPLVMEADEPAVMLGGAPSRTRWIMC